MAEDQADRSKYVYLGGALCGLIGPACFIAGWVTVGAITPHYSGSREAISQLARIGAPHRLWMTAAFFVFGLMMLVFAQVLPEALEASWPLRVAISLAGLATLGVAAFPLGHKAGGTQDVVHASWAVSGYVGTALAPIIVGWILLKRCNAVVATVCILVGLSASAAFAAMSFSTYPGLLQRTGLSLVDIWFVVMAAWMVTGRRNGSRFAESGGVSKVRASGRKSAAGSRTS